MSLFENDLLVMIRFAFPAAHKVVILDPGKTVIRNYNSGFTFIYTRDQVLAAGKEKTKFILVNFSGASSFSFPFDFQNVEGIVSFNIGYETSTDFYHFEFFYVVDQQNSLRYIISENHRDTYFLHDYHQPRFITDVSNLFSGFSSFTNYFNVKLGKIMKVTDGNFQVLKRNKNFLDCIENEKYESLIIPVKINSPINQGVIRIQAFSNKRCTAVINHSILPAGQEKIGNEKMVVSEISKTQFKYLAIPEYSFSDFSICYFLPVFLKPPHHRQTKSLIIKSLTNAIYEYQAPYYRQISLKDLWKGNEIIKVLNWIRNKISQNDLPRGLSPTNLTKLYSHIIDMFNGMDINQSVYVSLNNHSLNDENMYSDKDKLYFTSWINADFDLPLFSDIFYNEIGNLEEPRNIDTDGLINNFEVLMNDPDIIENADKFEINLKQYLKIYMILNCSKELQAIISKKIVLPEVNVYVYNWLKIAENTTSNSD
jgi:hypothetical protein